MPRLFGKEYAWGMVDGRLTLEPVGAWDSVPQRYVMSYPQLVSVLGRIEAEGGVSDADREGEGRIPLGINGHGVSDPEAGGDAGVSNQREQGAAGDQVACQEGHREEGSRREAHELLREVCPPCRFEYHADCWAPARCACCKDYEEVRSV